MSFARRQNAHQAFLASLSPLTGASEADAQLKSTISPASLIDCAWCGCSTSQAYACQSGVKGSFAKSLPEVPLPTLHPSVCGPAISPALSGLGRMSRRAPAAGSRLHYLLPVLERIYVWRRRTSRQQCRVHPIAVYNLPCSLSSMQSPARLLPVSSWRSLFYAKVTRQEVS